MSSVGIVVPAYRPDSDRLAAFVRALEAELDPATIRIELDAPAPATEAALSELPATVATVPERRGKGAAITAGFECLETDVLALADADGATPAASVGNVVAPVCDDEVDLAVGSRRHPDADIRSHQTYVRRWLGDGFAWLARRLLTVDLYDYQCGAKAIDRQAWRAVRSHLYEPGFAWDVELVAMAGALDRRVREVPVTWKDRPGSTVAPVATSLELLRALFPVRHRAKLLADHPLHSMIAARREESPALVERLEPEATE